MAALRAHVDEPVEDGPVELAETETVEGFVLVSSTGIPTDAAVPDNSVIGEAVPVPQGVTEGDSTPMLVGEEPLPPPVKQGEEGSAMPNPSEAAVTDQDSPAPALVTPSTSAPAVGSNRKKKAEPALRVRRIPVEEGWREKLSIVMDRSKPDGVSTPIGVVMDLSSATSVELVEDESAIEVKGWEWQNLQEAEALIRLLFRDYREGYSWWFYSVPSFSALCECTSPPCAA